MTDWEWADDRKRKLMEQCEALKAQYPAAVELRLTYYGYGDEGSFDCATLDVGTEELCVAGRAELEEITCELASAHNPGWNQSSGSRGAIIVDMQAMTARLQHTWIVEREEDEEPVEL